MNKSPHPGRGALSLVPPSMPLGEAVSTIWAPEEHPLRSVAEAALRVLETPGAQSRDVYQAAHLLTTYRRALLSM